MEVMDVDIAGWPCWVENQRQGRWADNSRPIMTPALQQTRTRLYYKEDNQPDRNAKKNIPEAQSVPLDR